MWRMMLVTTLVAAVYFGLSPRGNSSVLDWNVETFGQPYTLPMLAAELRASGVDVKLEQVEVLRDPRTDFPGRSDLLPSLGGPVLTASGTIGGRRGGITIYMTTGARSAIWREDEGHPEVWARGYGRFPEDHAMGLKNAVIELSTLVGPGGDDAYRLVRGSIVRLRKQ